MASSPISASELQHRSGIIDVRIQLVQMRSARRRDLFRGETFALDDFVTGRAVDRPGWVGREVHERWHAAARAHDFDTRAARTAFARGRPIAALFAGRAIDRRGHRREHRAFNHLQLLFDGRELRRVMRRARNRCARTRWRASRSGRPFSPRRGPWSRSPRPRPPDFPPLRPLRSEPEPVALRAECNRIRDGAVVVVSTD